MEGFDAGTEAWDKEEACIELTNHLIVLCNLSFPRVSSLFDITSQLFILIFKKVTGIVPHDLVTEPQCIEDEAHNIQIIIDTLSLDILNISLSHITGEDIIACNALSIYNLLEILENFLLYPSAEFEESKTSVPELSTRDKVTDILSNNEQVEASSTTKSTEPETLPSNGNHQSTESHIHSAPLLKEDEEVTAFSREPCLNKICPLCIYSNKEVAELSDKNNDVLKLNKTEIRLRESSQSSLTAYQELPEKLGTPMSVNFVPNEIFTSSSSSRAEEKATTESSTLTSPLIPESYASSSVLNPEFTKIVLQSAKDKPLYVNHPLESSHPYISRELQDLPGENNSKIVHEENEDQIVYPHPIQQLNTPSCKILPSEKQDAARTYSSDNLPAKKNVRFSSQQPSENSHLTTEAMRRNSIYNKMFAAPRKTPSSVLKKSAYLPRNVGHTITTKRKNIRIRKVHHRKVTSTIEQENLARDNNFLQELQQEFPYVYLSPASVRRMQQQYNHHLHILGNHLRDAHLKKTRTQIQYEEAERRKAILSEMLRKEMAHNRRMRFLREQKQNYQRAKAVLCEKQQSRVQMKQLYDSYQQYIKQKIMRKRTKEERLLSQLYQDGLSMYKEELRELRKRAKEREEVEAAKHKKYLDSMENFYKTQFSLLAESLAEEKENFQQRAKAQKRVLDQIRRDYRQDMESEVKALQEQLIQDDDIHFREMDAERIRDIWHKKGICPFLSKRPNKMRRQNKQNADYHSNA